MAFKSEAQRKKFLELVKKGKMKQSVYDEFAKDTPHGKLPERVRKKSKDDIS